MKYEIWTFDGRWLLLEQLSVGEAADFMTEGASLQKAGDFRNLVEARSWFIRTIKAQLGDMFPIRTEDCTINIPKRALEAVR